MTREITPRDLSDRLRSGAPTVLVDVRNDWERELVTLAESLHLPVEVFPMRAAEVPSPPGALIVTFCHHGVRSLAAAEWLEGMGRTDVVSLAGGIDAWAEEVDPKLPRY